MEKQKATTKRIKKQNQPHTDKDLALPSGVSEEISPSQLILDPENLRLLERVGEKYNHLSVKLFSQPAIQKEIFDLINSDSRLDIQALATSIASNGFLRHERLIVAKFDSNNYLVLEGNRRLTAVKRLIQEGGPEMENLRPTVRESLRTLPCFVLEGAVIDKSEEALKAYRRAAEIYIGMRHLMGAKNWEPASRYEFQSRLIFDEKWSIEDVANRFGRKSYEVIRDIKAHLLYKDFVEFETESKLKHSLTYNAFAEAARSPDIAKWLDWNESALDFKNKENEATFFHYLIDRLSSEPSFASLDEEVTKASSEATVRRLREILKLGDKEVEEHLRNREFKSAELLYEERKEGTLSKKIASFNRTLRKASQEDLLESSETKERLMELQTLVQRTLKIINALAED